MDNKNKPILYSKTAIVLFSCISSFISGLLYVANLKAAGKNKHVLAMTLYALFAAVICVNTLEYAGIPLIVSYLPVNIICGILLTTIFWDAQIETNEYTNKSVIYPLIITSAVILCIMTIIYLKNPNSNQKRRNKSVIKNMELITVSTIFLK